LSVLLLLWFAVNMPHVSRCSFSGQCEESGRLLIGGKCVEKVQIDLTKRKQCPALVLANGKVELINSGRLTFAELECDPGRVMAPQIDMHLVCRIQGRWSKALPACLEPGCVAPPPPGNGGAVDLAYNDTVARFRCEKGWRLEPAGGAVLGCVDGRNWNDTVPTCVRKETPRSDRATDLEAGGRGGGVAAGGDRSVRPVEVGVLVGAILFIRGAWTLV